MLFLAKDPSLGLFLLDGLIKYWPFANSPKEVMFISELIEVLETCEVQKLEPYIPKVFKRLVKCISGLHLQVADRAMCFFENDYFLNILKTYKSYTFPLLVPIICHLAETHWHKVLQESLNALKSILKEIDPVMFEKAMEKKDQNKLYIALQDPKQIKKEKQKNEEKWKNLLRMAQQKNPNLKEPILPYADNHVVGDFNGISNGNVNISWLPISDSLISSQLFDCFHESYGNCIKIDIIWFIWSKLIRLIIRVKDQSSSMGPNKNGLEFSSLTSETPNFFTFYNYFLSLAFSS